MAQVKLSPKIKLGCSKCGNKIEIDDLNFYTGNFELSKNNKITSLNRNPVRSSKVKSLF